MFGKLVDFDLILEEIAGKQFKCMKTSLANTTLTAMLDRMENSGLIIRKFDPKDRRNRLIVLTLCMEP